jgi:hypothetical protein
LASVEPRPFGFLGKCQWRGWLLFGCMKINLEGKYPYLNRYGTGNL